jgi:erythromycin esterase-like protein
MSMMAGVYAYSGVARRQREDNTIIVASTSHRLSETVAVLLETTVRAF